MSAATATTTVRLAWEDPSTGEELEWNGPLPIRIGRAAENDIVLNAAAVSREHARLEREGATIVLTDNGSSNGTFVGGRRISREAIGDGTSIILGPFTLTVDLNADQPTVFANGGRGGAATGSLHLKWVDPAGGAAREMRIERELTIGRNSDCAIPLATDRASRRHATIAPEGNGAILTDLNSANGTFVNGQRINRTSIKSGDEITIGDVQFRVEGFAPVSSAGQEAGTQIIDARQFNLPAGNDATVAGLAAPTIRPVSPSAPLDGRTVILDLPDPMLQARAPRSFPPPIFDAPYVPIASLAATGLPVDETVYLAVGGGLGSYIWVDTLLIHGANKRGVVSIGLEDKPYGRYARLCRQSQIPLHERLRSNSDSRPDNIWGWPGYAVRESFLSFFKGEFGNAFKRAWQIFTEPVYDDTYTPRSGDVFRSIDQEAKRIGWDQIWRFGRVRAIRKTDDGRYVIAYSQSTPQNPSAHRLILARYVHLSVGYPGIKLLPDLQRYRVATGDFKTVVNAYEEHEQVYQGLIRNGGTVLVRGRGIVASRIMQRLYEIRQQNPRIGVLHLMRSPVPQGNKYLKGQREVINHWEFQAFNWPKACWSGEYLQTLERAGDQERDRLLNDWGGTTTAHRKDWIDIVQTGLNEGWYQIRFGEVKDVQKGPDGKVITTLIGKGTIRDETDLVADYIIDCTGLESTIEANPLLHDLVEHHGLGRNPKGRLKMANDFEVVGMENNGARMYAAGSITLGGPHAGVDTFLGMQYAALQAVQALAKHRAPGVRRLNFITSPYQWLKWVVGAKV